MAVITTNTLVVPVPDIDAVVYYTQTGGAATTGMALVIIEYLPVPINL